MLVNVLKVKGDEDESETVSAKWHALIWVDGMRMKRKVVNKGDP